jgi:D-beta-D-heptose 7-phosphate kinase/D-beta-D-heptose 1-phosphate adenosyltransferase
MKSTNKRSVVKKSSGSDKASWVMVSGGFDPIHIGHVRMFEKARKLGDKLVVVINNDHWLMDKKGYVFMSQKERGEIIASFPSVNKVVFTDHKPGEYNTDKSVCRAIQKLKPAIFANGGDRKPDGDPVPEVELCKKLGIKLAYNVGAGGKVQSSSWMIGDASRNFVRSVRPWGEFYGWDAGKEWKLKTIYIAPGKRLSLQYHHHRREHWMLVEGDATATIHDAKGAPQVIPMKKGEALYVDVGATHRLESKKGGIVVEIALGNFDENDIVRVEDDHGRASA